MRKEKLEQLKQIVEELKTIEVKDRIIEQKDKFLQSKAYDFKLNNGIIIHRERLDKGGKDGSAAIIMPVLPNNEVLNILWDDICYKISENIINIKHNAKITCGVYHIDIEKDINKFKCFITFIL